MVPCVYILQNDHHNVSSWHPSTHTVTEFFLVMKTFKTFSFSNSQTYNTVLLSRVTDLHTTSP